MNLSEQLRRLDACDDALNWVDKNVLDFDAAWKTCPRGDWLLWLAAHVGADRKTIVLAACDCAETALVHIPEGEDRPRLAIETARRWCRGETTIDDVLAASDAAYAAAAYAAARAAGVAPDAYAAYAYAAYAADAAAACAYAAYAAAYAGAAAAAAADVAVGGRVESLARSADIARALIEGNTVRRLLDEVTR